MNVNILKLNEPDFPDCLSVIANPPDQIYWAGIHPKEWLDKPKVAIVGSRMSTPYGKTITAKLAKELAEAGVVIISGLAFGIDVAAHQAALSANGITIAVLATGLDNISPRSHHHIAQQITRKGTLMSERPAGSNVHLGHFVIRNRLISGLVDVVLIPEAVLKSGSLHTARFALDQGKTVMAVPGNINSPASQGSNNLIKSGAIPVTSAEDIFFALKINPRAAKAKRAFSGSKHEQLVFEFIKEGISAQDEIAVAARLDGPALASALTMLELSGYIRPAGAGNWVLS